MGKRLNSSTLGRKLLWSDRTDASWKECGLTRSHTHIHTFTSLCCGIRIQTVKLLWQEADVSWLPCVCLPGVFSVCKKNTQFVLADISCPCTEYCIYFRYEVIGGDIVAWGLEFLFMIMNLQKVNPQVLAALALCLCCLISVAVRIKRCAAWDCGIELMLCESVWRCVWQLWWGVCDDVCACVWCFID